MKAYYCTCKVKTGVQVYLAVSTALSAVVLALVLQEQVLTSMARFFSVALLSEPRPQFANLDFETMRRYTFVISQNCTPAITHIPGASWSWCLSWSASPTWRPTCLPSAPSGSRGTRSCCPGWSWVRGQMSNKNNVECFLTLVSFHPGALEIIGFLATGAYHLYLLWATHEDVIYQVNKSTMYFSDIYFEKCIV